MMNQAENTDTATNPMTQAEATALAIDAVVNGTRLTDAIQGGPITITREHLAALLIGIKGATFATITASTDPRMVKKHRETGEANPFLGTVKVSRVNATLGAFYEASVNRQRAREGSEADFASAGLPDYYEHVSGCVIRHKGKDTLYLACKPERCLSVTFLNPTGDLIDADDVKPYLPAQSDSKAHQGVEREVVWRTYALESIREIVLGGEHYLIQG